MKKRTHKEFLKMVTDIVGYDKYEFLTEYIGCDKKITIKCKEDGYTWSINANGFLNNKCHCPKCSNKVMNKDTSYFKNQLKEIYNDEYTCLGEYVGAKIKVSIKHNTCGNIFEVTPDGITNGRRSGCPKCNHRKGADKLFVSHEEFVNRIDIIFNKRFTILSPYKGNHESVTVRHEDCGRVYDRQAGDMLQGKGCKWCGWGATKDTQWFKEKVQEMYQGEYSVLGEYVGSSTKILIKHNKCKKEYLISPSNFIHGARCKCQSISKGEKIIETFLHFNNIKFKQEYTYSDCKDKSRLPFDVAVKDNLDNVLLLIEYDGIQHFKAVRGEKQFKSTQHHDRIKNEYCRLHNIKLLRISYLDYNNINNILIDFFKQYLFKNTEIPTVGLNIWEEANQYKLIKILKELPNGVYPKRYIIDRLNSSTIVSSLDSLFRMDCVKEIAKPLGIEISGLSMVVSNNYIDYKSYRNIIKINFESNNIKTISMFKQLYDNINKINDRHYKRDIFEDMNCFKSVKKDGGNYLFVLQFLKDNAISMDCNYVRKINKKEWI